MILISDNVYVSFSFFTASLELFYSKTFTHFVFLVKYPFWDHKILAQNLNVDLLIVEVSLSLHFYCKILNLICAP